LRAVSLSVELELCGMAEMISPAIQTQSQRELFALMTMLRSGRAIGCCIHFVPARVKGAGTVPRSKPHEFNVPQKEQNELLGALASMKGDIVEK
jgi:hypothetical protein